MNYELTGVAPDFSKRDWLLIFACIKLITHMQDAGSLPVKIEVTDELNNLLKKVNLKCK